MGRVSEKAIPESAAATRVAAAIDRCFDGVFITAVLLMRPERGTGRGGGAGWICSGVPHFFIQGVRGRLDSVLENFALARNNRSRAASYPYMQA
jgi:hypothetical protein